ncbi:MAG: carbon starvation protein A [Phycisphaerales bacterium]
MGTLLIAVGALVGYLIAYHTYGRWLARKIFKLDPEAKVPSVELNDDRDYVPTNKAIVFGHHFTSIAGTGPIVGPAIAVMWGWLPALLWVFLGSIFIGAVHDFGALVVSLRSRGQTVGDIAGRVLNWRVRLMFLFVLFMALTIVLAIFGLVIAAVFKQYPAAIFPCTIQIPIAIVIGLYLHRKGVNLLLPSLLALAVMYVTVVFGDVNFFTIGDSKEIGLGALNAWMASWPTIVWVGVLLVYSYIASVLPVWTLLQPRDYINSLQLLTALGLILVGLFVAAFLGGAPPDEGAVRQPLEIAAPLVRWTPEGAPMLIPFLFITIACGAISGFHCLVSSGTSSKQLKCESDAQFVGYGSMLTEGFLATLVILACVAGLGLGVTKGLNAGPIVTGEAAYLARYASWGDLGLAAKVGAFVDGSANFLKAIGIPAAVAVALMGVLVASFAGTTLDTACRLQRYVIQELASTIASRPASATSVYGNVPMIPLTWLTNKHGATIFAIVLAGILAALPGPGTAWSMQTAGTGGLILWPLFGATNQLLGGLAFLVIAFYLWRRKTPVWFLIFPMLFMLAMPAAAMVIEIPRWIQSDAPNWPVIVIAAATLALEVWMIVEALLLWPKVRGKLEAALPPLGVDPVLATNPGSEGGRSC